MGKIHPALPRIPSLQLCFDASKTGFGIGSKVKGAMQNFFKIPHAKETTNLHVATGTLAAVTVQTLESLLGLLAVYGAQVEMQHGAALVAACLDEHSSNHLLSVGSDNPLLSLVWPLHLGSTCHSLCFSFLIWFADSTQEPPL
jgi:hypothetical protein